MPVKTLGIFFVICLMAIAARAFADTKPIEITMDNTQLVHLKQDAASVIVANPEHVSVTLDNPRLLILTPHAAGVTSMIVLDNRGRTILEQDIIISNVKKNYVRVRRMCTGSDGSCNAQSYDYCPDGCYDVTEVPADGGSASGPPPPKGLIEGEPAETLIGPLDDCPEGYDKTAVPGIKSDMHYTCSRR